MIPCYIVIIFGYKAFKYPLSNCPGLAQFSLNEKSTIAHDFHLPSPENVRKSQTPLENLKL